MADRADALRPKPKPTSRPGPLLYALLGLLFVLEVAWLGWYLFEPLPNVPPTETGGRIRRWIFAARALPEVVPGVSFEQSYLGLALKDLSHLEYLPQRLPIVLAAGYIAAAAVALGCLAIRALGLQKTLRWFETLPLTYGLGTTGLGVLTLILGRFGALSPWPIRVGLGALILAEVVLRVRGGDWRVSHHEPGPNGKAGRRGVSALVPNLGLGLVLGPFLILMALGAMLPTIDFDAIEYHLQGPKEYYKAGWISFLPHNVYTSMPFSIEMLHLLGMEVLDDWWSGALVGQLLIASFAPAGAAMVALTARSWGSSRGAWVGAVVYLTTPWIYRLGVLPYVEGPLCYYHAALVWAAARAWPEPDPRARVRLWALVGLLAGGAMACKYPALISAIIPFGVLALAASIRRRTPSSVLAFVAGWAVVMAPWLAKNVVDTGNPVYPLAYRVFGGRHWDAELDAKWTHGHGPKPITLRALGTSLVDVAGRSDWQSALYVALAPLSLLRPASRRQSLVLWGLVAYLFGTWWLLTHRLDRFWLPILAPLAVLAGLGADWIRHRGWSAILYGLIVISTMTNLSYVSTALTGLNEWTASLEDLRTRVPEMLNPPLASLESHVSPNSKVLLVGQAAVFHVRIPIVYNTVFNHETFQTLTEGVSPEKVRESFRSLGITHVYVDWFEIERYRSPGNYGFTSYVTPREFTRLVDAGVLDSPEALGKRQDLYRVR